MKAIWQKLLGKMQQALQKREVDSLKSTVIILEFLIFYTLERNICEKCTCRTYKQYYQNLGQSIR